MVCSGVPFPSVLVQQDKQPGDVFLASSEGTKGKRICFVPSLMVIDWVKAVYIYMHFVGYLLRAAPPVNLSEVTVSRQGRERPDKEETTATQNVIAEVIYLVCFGRANIISTLLIF